jgi:ferric-dicitrate binding protein FerR (iron transport regulator)
MNDEVLSSLILSHLYKLSDLFPSNLFSLLFFFDFLAPLFSFDLLALFFYLAAVKSKKPIIPGHSEAESYRVAYLVVRFMREDLTEAEHDELDAWVNTSMYNQQMFEKLINPDNPETWDQWKDKLDESGKYLIPPPGKKSKLRVLLPWIIIACILLSAAVAIPFVLSVKKERDAVEAATVTTKDIEPGTDRAQLTLADGSVIILNNLLKNETGPGKQQQVFKQDTGMISYQTTNPLSQSSTVQYNTLITPAAGKFKIQLPDGSLVWLNAASSLRYPLVFTAGIRKVELKGEAYFEVVKDAAHPFIIETGNTTIEVLGTHFNINAYADEPLMKITLSEGTVKINHSVTIQPGQQAQLNNRQAELTTNPDIHIVNNVNLATELAWKDGLFIFESAPLEDLMRDVARWYDADIEYQFVSPDHFNAEIPRNTPVSRLLHLLEGTRRVHFKIENRRIIVMK